MNFSYVGNGAYCYANVTAMMLTFVGEDIAPSFIEPITGVGLSATIKKSGFLFLNNQTLEPDLGITKALDVLGFNAEVHVSQDPEDMHFDELKAFLEKQPVILGPLDMGYLTYNPNHTHLHGADHFVFAYGSREDLIYLHDPAGFPHVFISKEDLQKSWKAEKVFYRKGYYRYITNVKRVNSPSKQDIYQKALKRFVDIYRDGEAKTRGGDMHRGSQAILNTKKRLEDDQVSQQELDFFKYFVFQLGSRRALDFAAFFDYKDSDLADLKRQQARLLGEAHTFTVAKNFDSLGNALKQLAEVEDTFRDALLSKPVSYVTS